MQVFSQKENLHSGKYHIAKKVFEQSYKKMSFSKIPRSKIQIDSAKVYLETMKIIEMDTHITNKLMLIVQNGLLDPTYINGSYTLRISAFDELPLLNPNAQTKRFSFWMVPTPVKIKNKEDKALKPLTSSANPHEYYFELQNPNADETTSFEDFVTGAQLTFLKFGTIIL